MIRSGSLGPPKCLCTLYRALVTELWNVAANPCDWSTASLTTASMRPTKLVPMGDGVEFADALAKIGFEPLGNGPIHDPALRNAGVRFVWRCRNPRQDGLAPCAEADQQREERVVRRMRRAWVGP